ncbi:MAG: FixH family protein [Sphingobacteriales bacterium]
MTKLNWGHKIALVYLLFVAGIIYLVVQASRQNIDLVTENYYAEEIQYQQRIDEKNNTQSLSAPLEINVHQGVLTVSFPEEFSQKELKGEVQLYCPSDAKKDLSSNLQMENNKTMISLPEQNQGFHQLKVKWEAEGVKYYFEKNLMLN